MLFLRCIGSQMTSGLAGAGPEISVRTGFASSDRLWPGPALARRSARAYGPHGFGSSACKPGAGLASGTRGPASGELPRRAPACVRGMAGSSAGTASIRATCFGGLCDNLDPGHARQKKSRRLSPFEGFSKMAGFLLAYQAKGVHHLEKLPFATGVASGRRSAGAKPRLAFAVFAAPLVRRRRCAGWRSRSASPAAPRPFRCLDLTSTTRITTRESIRLVDWPVAGGTSWERRESRVELVHMRAQRCSVGSTGVVQCSCFPFLREGVACTGCHLHRCVLRRMESQRAPAVTLLFLPPGWSIFPSARFLCFVLFGLVSLVWSVCRSIFPPTLCLI